MAREIALDLGSGFNPMIGELRENIVGHDKFFVCVDSDFKSSLFVKNLNYPSLCANTKLPFKGNSVSLIFAKDFAGYPGCIDRFQGFVKADFSLDDLAREWGRIIKKGGKLIVLETATPPDINLVKDVFAERGFYLEEENYGELSYEVFRWGGKVKAPKSAYSLVFRKW